MLLWLQRAWTGDFSVEIKWDSKTLMSIILVRKADPLFRQNPIEQVLLGELILKIKSHNMFKISKMQD